MGRNYWMVVTSLESFRVCREMGFTVQGIRSRHRRKAERMQPQDRILYYITGIQRFAGVATVTSSHLEDHSFIRKSDAEGENYPLRVNIAPDLILGEEQFLDARQLGPRLDYVKRWAPEQWHLAFQGGLHPLPQRDFRLIEGEMRKIALARRKAATQP